MKFQNILDIAQKYMYFFANKNNNSILFYNYGPSGSLLLENLKFEWIYSNIINRDISVYLFTQKESEEQKSYDHYVSARNFHNKQLPFGVAKIYNDKKEFSDDAPITESSYFKPLNFTHLSSEVFITPSEAYHYFLHWQRQRKLWWKKLAQSPSRLSLGEIQKSDDGSTSVEILASFPWGTEVMETISITQMKNDTDLTAVNGRKAVNPTVVKNIMNLDAALMGIFCDGYEEERKSHKSILRVNKKLAPYKCIFASPDSSTESSVRDELSMLAFSLSKQLKKAGISTVYLSKDSKTTLASQMERNDEWGIPFTIIMDSSALKTGIINMRDRDTTLSEQVHVSEIVSHMKKLTKSL